MAVNNDLSEEIIIEEILIRLPMKSLVRYRCVCKLWNSQSYNPDFVSRFNQNPNRENDDDDDDDNDDDDYIICMNEYVDDTKLPCYGVSILSRNNNYLETHMDYTNVVPFPLLINLIGSINGLVCIAFNTFKSYNHQFILWNPTIRIFKKIIAPIHLNYGPFLYGFGWDSHTNDYKLIIAAASGRADSPAVVYSCKTDCWNNVQSISDSVTLPVFRKPPCVIVNGSPYWRVQQWSFNSNTNHDIVKFDIRNNKFTYLNVSFEISRYSLINLNDCLALINFENDYATAVYRFDEEPSSIWVKIYAIDKSVIAHKKPPLCLFKYGGEIVFDNKKQLYDPKSHTIKCCLPGSCTCPVKSHNKIKCRGCGESLVNGFSYTPSTVALPGMKALHRIADVLKDQPLDG